MLCQPTVDIFNMYFQFSQTDMPLSCQFALLSVYTGSLSNILILLRDICVCLSRHFSVVYPSIKKIWKWNMASINWHNAMCYKDETCMTQMPIVASMGYLFVATDHTLLIFCELFDMIKPALVSINKFINRILEIYLEHLIIIRQRFIQNNT